MSLKYCCAHGSSYMHVIIKIVCNDSGAMSSELCGRDVCQNVY